MKTRTSTPRIILLLGSILALASPLTKADLVYYMPFDDGASASLANDGTAGGTGTALTGISGATAPSGSQVQVAPNLGSTWSEYYPVSGPTETNNRGGTVILPNSTTEFRLDSDSTPNQMTISTWVYWNGNAGGTITSPAGIASTMNASNTEGWSLRIQMDGKIKFAWVQTAGSGRNRETVSSAITAGQWMNAVLVFDSNLSTAMAVYVNGAAQATTGSGGDPLMGIIKSDENSIATGLSFHNAGSGRQSLNGYMDDYAMWDTALTAAQINSLNTAPTVLSGYNAGVMNNLFEAYDAEGSTIVDALTWEYTSGFDATGRSLGDTWEGGDGNYYIWLDGDSSSALGMVSSIPEAQTTALAFGILGLLVIARRIKSKRS